MHVKKRSGGLQSVSFDKITARLRNLCDDPATGPALQHCDCELVAQKTCAAIYDGISTAQLDILSSEIAVALCTTHPDYETLAARVVVSNMHKQTSPSVLSTFSQLWEAKNAKGESYNILNKPTWEVLRDNHALLDSWLNWDADYGYNYMAIKTLESLYLTRVNGVVVERPQHLLLRVSIGIWGQDLGRAKDMYRELSQRLYIHATPTLFNSGMHHPQLSSCFLLGIEAQQESVEGIYDTFGRCAKISKFAGGIGIQIINLCASSKAMPVQFVSA